MLSFHKIFTHVLFILLFTHVYILRKKNCASVLFNQLLRVDCVIDLGVLHDSELSSVFTLIRW